jgi:catechol 2,3-dioxygenase-like lactoylglutathione lyase family enzyme
MRLEHVNLTVADVDRSVAFYRDLFGFGLRWEGSIGDGRRGAHVGGDAFYLALFEAVAPGRAPYDYGAVGINHFGFVVDDLDAMVDRMAGMGVEYVAVPDYEPGRRVYLFDPDGHEIEVVEYAGVASELSPTAAA